MMTTCLMLDCGHGPAQESSGGGKPEDGVGEQLVTNMKQTSHGAVFTM